MSEETNIKTITAGGRRFLVPNLSAFEQKEIYFKIRPTLVTLSMYYGQQQNLVFNDDILENMLCMKEISADRQWIEDLLMRGVREYKDGKNVMADIESFHDAIHSVYIPLLVGILKENFEDFFCSLKRDVEKIASIARATSQQ